MSEAAARAARERSEQEREPRRFIAKRSHLSALPLGVVSALIAVALLAVACRGGEPGVGAPETSPDSEDSLSRQAAAVELSPDGDGSSEDSSGPAGKSPGEPSASGEPDGELAEEALPPGAGPDGSTSSEGDACPEELLDLDFQCLLVAVPVDRNDPESGVIDISVVIRPGRAGSSRLPMAVLQGGPGGASSGLAAYLPSRPHPQVFIDQRGTGFGGVDFSCPEVLEVLPELLAATREEARAIEAEAYGRCADRLSGHPALAHTTTAAHAADVVDVMAALGYERWLVYGVSYGTTIALEVLRDPPDGLLGAVLDGVFPPDLDLDRDIAFAAERAMGELDEACVADPACAAILAEAPGGEGATVSGLLYVLIAEGNIEPFTVSLAASDTSVGEAVDVWMDGDSVASLLFEILYVEDWIGLVPSLVARLVGGDEAALQLLAVLGVELSVYSLGSNASGTYFAVTCADRLPFTSGPPAPNKGGPFAAAVIGEGVAAGCEQWPVAPSPPSVAEPVTSDLPVLLLSGRFDPITPPDFAKAAAERLAAATLVVRDGSSHGTWGFDGCINRIVDDFATDPSRPVDTSCAEEPRPLEWIPIR